MAMLSKACKLDNFESHNSLKLSFMNIQGLWSNFVDCESFPESNSPDILALCETNLEDSTDSDDLPVRGYLPLIQKDSTIHVQISQFISRKNFLLHRKTLQILTYVLDWRYLTRCPTSFSFLFHSVFFILFRLIQIRFSQSTYLLISLFLESLMSIIRIG